MSGIHRVLEGLTALFAVATLPVGVLAGMFMGGEVAAVVFIVGWFFLVPVTGILAGTLSDPAEEIERAKEIRDLAAGIGDDKSTASDEREADPLQTLRRRYANGEIDDRELERGLEALLETEDVRADDADAISEALERLDGPDSTASRRAADSDSREPAFEVE